MRYKSLTQTAAGHCLAALALMITANFAFSAEQTYEEWSAETRTSLNFRVNADVVNALLPAGWQVPEVAESPGRVNLGLTFMDRHVVLNAHGEAIGSGTSRYMVMSVQARNQASGQSSVMIINGVSPEGTGSYEVYQPATEASASRSVSGHGTETGLVEETWQMTAISGDSIRLHLHYEPAPPTRRQATLVIRSAKNTDYTRTYKIDQATDALGTPGAPNSRLHRYEFTAEGPLFSKIFDGTEQLQSVTSTPWYHREIYIP
ncbi:hypothetical protein [Pseudohongiella spirulinae]|uniref:Uncharacterized protein n=1 Tax=Pseudohongiella spirulinae TaxID=1249552 RepID=A0A0S2KC43_9GAMM|nr:hypothetical protein [Pseudohongiella spirulinae]ALO45522.1 hypothetical protein PS2015_850 [Pseudohongiella spirulinae]